MTRQELREKIATALTHAFQAGNVDDSLTELLETELPEAMHLIDEYCKGLVPEKREVEPSKGYRTQLQYHEELLNKSNTIGYNQAIDDISRRAGIGEKHE